MGQKEPARVRIAPSPTGDPHVGTAYMALFNKALADSSGGAFVLRIEDTDRTRYVADSERQIFEALDWLGLSPDEGPPEFGPGGDFGPYRQSERRELYVKAAERLVREGKAYRCFCTSDRLAALRKIQQAEKFQHIGYDGLCRGLSAEEVAAKQAEGIASVIRFKMPKDGEIAAQDLFRGALTFPAADLQDAVIMKSDGFPTYHLAVIVDDHAMEITHVIRAEEWIPSLPLHFELYRALGFEPPVFAHMPLLRNKDKSKISKRKNPTSLLWYRDAGFLPEALRNFLSLMGYSMPNDLEIYSYEEFLKEFALEKVNIGGPVFDLQKLQWLNGEYIRALPTEELAERLVDFIGRLQGREGEFKQLPEDEQPKEQFLRSFEIKRRRWSLMLAKLAPTFMAAQESDRSRLLRIVPLIQERIHTLCEAADYLPMFFKDSTAFESKAEDYIPKKSTLEKGREALEAMKVIVETTDFDDPNALATMDTRAREKADELGLNVGQFFFPIRKSVTGENVSPPLLESIMVLGKKEALARIQSSVLATRIPDHGSQTG